MILLLLAITGCVLVFSISESRAVNESAEYWTAFHLAEGGLAAAKWEITEGKDPQGDGIGNKTVQTSVGTYAVTAVDLGGGTYQLASTGVAGGVDVLVEEVVESRKTTRFPFGAITVVGDVDREKIKIKTHLDLTLDGGDSPAIVTTDRNLYAAMGQAFAEAVVRGLIPVTSLLGRPLNTFQLGSRTVELPIQFQQQYAQSLNDLNELYLAFVARTNALIPRAQVLTDASLRRGNNLRSEISIGSAEQPATVYIPDDLHLEPGQTLSGQGTLILSSHVHIKKGATLNWNGNVVVTGEGTRNGDLHVDSGSLNVTGNLVVLAEGNDSSRFTVHNGGTARVDGSLFMGTEFMDNKATKVKLDVKQAGDLKVNGLVTLLGSKVEARFHHDGNFDLTGMLQMALRDSSKPDRLRVDLDGRVKIHLNRDAMQKGVDAMQSLEGALNLPEVETIITKDLKTVAWWWGIPEQAPFVRDRAVTTTATP
jgi:hypothetical protein